MGHGYTVLFEIEEISLCNYASLTVTPGYNRTPSLSQQSAGNSTAQKHLLDIYMLGPSWTPRNLDLSGLVLKSPSVMNRIYRFQQQMIGRRSLKLALRLAHEDAPRHSASRVVICGLRIGPRRWIWACCGIWKDSILVGAERRRGKAGKRGQINEGIATPQESGEIKQL